MSDDIMNKLGRSSVSRVMWPSSTVNHFVSGDDRFLKFDHECCPFMPMSSDFCRLEKKISYSDQSNIYSSRKFIYSF